MDQEMIQLFETCLRDYGIEFQRDGVLGAVRHLELVAEWNERVNLTAITAPRDMVVKHALDSALVLRQAPLSGESTVVDVGTGAGFPGLTLKCLRPAIRLTLVESLNKRCRFLEAAGGEVLPLANARGGCSVVWGRAEDVGQQREHREKYDLVVARAVADLRVLSEYCLPFCRVGGAFIALKGPSIQDELTAAQRAISELGGEVEVVEEVALPFGAGNRTLVRIRKGKATSSVYPRKAGLPAKSPL